MKGMDLNVDPYTDWALPRIADAMHSDVETLVRHAVRQWLALNHHLAKDAKATLGDFAVAEYNQHVAEKGKTPLRRRRAPDGKSNG